MSDHDSGTGTAATHPPQSGKMNKLTFSDAVLTKMNNPDGDVHLTELGAALMANKGVEVGKVQKAIRKMKSMVKGRPKLKHLNMAQKRKKQERHFARKFEGKVIRDGKHELYILTAGMMHGMRVTLGAVSRRVHEQLKLEDFSEVVKINFAPKGNPRGQYPTPPHNLQHTFKFKSYAPTVFQKLREFFGLDMRDYVMSICGDFNFVEFISNSKSGQFFFYSHDGRYMIKTQTKDENRFMKRILPHYYKYITENPHTMMVRIFGMQRVKMYHLKRKVHFVIMESVFNTPEKIHTIYDLKGSRLGREATPAERESGGVLKDNDLVNSERKFKLGPKKELFMEQLRKDAMFMASLDIMDYSLLVGIHDRTKRSASRVLAMAPAQTPTKVQPISSGNASRPPSMPLSPVAESSENEEGVSTSASAADRSASLSLQSTSSSSNRSNTPFRRPVDTSGLCLPVPPGSANKDDSNISARDSQSEAAGGSKAPRGSITKEEMGAMTDVFALMNDMQRYGLDGQGESEVVERRLDRSLRKSMSINPNVLQHGALGDEDDDSDFDDGDSEEEDEDVPDVDDARATSEDIDVLMQDIEASHGHMQSVKSPAALDVEADPYKKYYELSVRMLQVGAARQKAKQAKKAEEQHRLQWEGGPKPNRRGSTFTVDHGDMSETVGSVDLAEEREGQGSMQEGKSIQDMMRTFNVSQAMRSLLGGSSKRSVIGEEDRKQIKLVKHTFGPGVTTRHPWTNRGDNGINSRTWVVQSRNSMQGGVVGAGDPNCAGVEQDGEIDDVEGEGKVEVGSKRGHEIYYVGIIDILQQYTMSKRAETWFKGMFTDTNLISSVDSVRYAKRFIAFIDANIE